MAGRYGVVSCSIDFVAMLRQCVKYIIGKNEEHCYSGMVPAHPTKTADC
jgi:hypothetical protein